MFFERSGYHLFSWRGIDVFVSMWYMILMGFIVFMPMFSGGSIISGVIFALAVTLSLLVHEYGHALVCQHYKLGPSILLHGFGGLCMSEPASSDSDDAKILLAGPFAGLAFGMLLILLKAVAPGLVSISPLIAQFVGALIFVNIVWSLVNLLAPVWPLDGGQLFHLLLRRFMREEKAQVVALNISIFTIIPLAIVGFMMLKSLIIALLGVFIVMDNINSLQSGRSIVARSSGREDNKIGGLHAELLAEAERALQEQDWREAYRLGHQMRASGKMPNKVVLRMWEILGIATTEMGKYEEALGYLKRAPQSADVATAIERCKLQS